MVLPDTPKPYLYAYCNRTVADYSVHAKLQCIMFRACHPEIADVTVGGMSLLLCNVSPPLMDAEKEVKRTYPGTITTILGLHIKTVQKILKNPSPRKRRSDKCKMKVLKTRDVGKIKLKVIKHAGCTSKSIFKNAGIENVAKTNRNRIFGAMAVVISPEKKNSIDKKTHYVEASMGLGIYEVRIVHR